MSTGCRDFLPEILAAGVRSADAAPRNPAVDAHLASCRFCAARLRAQERLLPALRQRPQLATGTAELLAGIHVRSIERVEGSALGRMLDAAMPVPATPLTGSVESAEDARFPETLLDPKMAALASVGPTPRSDEVWSRVRAVILERVAASAMPANRVRWMLGLVGAAALAVGLSTMIRIEREVPSIVFRDLDSSELASFGVIDFAVVRHGATR